MGVWEEVERNVITHSAATKIKEEEEEEEEETFAFCSRFDCV